MKVKKGKDNIQLRLNLYINDINMFFKGIFEMKSSPSCLSPTADCGVVGTMGACTGIVGKVSTGC